MARVSQARKHPILLNDTRLHLPHTRRPRLALRELLLYRSLGQHLLPLLLHVKLPKTYVWYNELIVFPMVAQVAPPLTRDDSPRQQSTLPLTAKSAAPPPANAALGIKPLQMGKKIAPSNETSGTKLAERRISTLSEAQIMDRLRTVVSKEDPATLYAKIKKVGQG